VKNPTTHEDKAAVLLPDGPTAPLVGQLIEHYKIVALLGNRKMLACSQETPGEPARLAVLPIDGGPPRVFDAKFQLPARMRWTPDGRAVTYIRRQDGLADIWSQPLEGGEPKRITNFKSDDIFSFDWSRDNKLAISHGTSASDVVLLRNHK
jgi:Tol biopolymer transport system component